MKTLTDGQQVKIKGFKHKTKLEVKYYPDNESCIIAEGAFLVDNYPGKDQEMAERQKNFENAIELSDGEVVMLNNEPVRVVVLGESFCDPVHLELF